MLGCEQLFQSLVQSCFLGSLTLTTLKWCCCCNFKIFRRSRNASSSFLRYQEVLNYIGEEGKSVIEKYCGRIPTATTGIILRKIIEFEQQGGDIFF